MAPEPKQILVTGASAGIGRAVASALVARGHRVWGTSRDAQRLNSVDGVRALALDLANEASIDSAAARGLAESGGFDVLVNNAGSGVWGPIEHLSAAQERDQFQVLVFGPMRLTRALLPAMRNQGHGLVINVTSLAAEFAIPFLGAYSAGKAALASMTWSLQMEMADDALRFVDVRPGDINSEFNAVMSKTPSSELGDYAENLHRAFDVYDRGMRGAPAPERVAAVVLRLVERNGNAPAVVAVGNTFQARIAPFLSRFASARLLRWCTARYYRLKH